MKDPDSGQRPPVSGGHGTGDGARPKRSRRRKGKQTGAFPASASPAHPGLQSGIAGPAESPQSRGSQSRGPEAQGEGARKRKRRRRGKAGSDMQQISVRPADDAAIAGAQDSRGKTRRHHGTRGLQGRPLASCDRRADHRTGIAVPAAPPKAGRETPQAPADGQAHGPDHGFSRHGNAAVHNGRRSAATQPPTGRRNEGQMPDAPFYAALDLGTNNCRLLVAQPTRPGQFRVVDAFSRIVRLGEGLGASGRLSDGAMNRSIEALKVCAAKLRSRNIRRSRLIATEACRAAENGPAFLERVKAEAGLELEIINRETEARLAVSGCSSLVGREAKSVVLFDIGGGSSEIAVIRIGENRSSRLANHITHWTSLPVGVVTLSERHGGRDVTPDGFAAMVREVEGMLSGFDCPRDGLWASPEDFHLIGTSGTVTTLAGVHLDLPRYDRRRVDGVWLSDDEVTAMQARLLSWDFSARAANPCIGPDRADLVLAGCAILEAIRNRWPSTRMRVADRGLREGLLTDMMADDGVWRRGRHRRQNRSGYRQAGAPEGSSP